MTASIIDCREWKRFVLLLYKQINIYIYTYIPNKNYRGMSIYLSQNLLGPIPLPLSSFTSTDNSRSSLFYSRLLVQSSRSFHFSLECIVSLTHWLIQSLPFLLRPIEGAETQPTDPSHYGNGSVVTSTSPSKPLLLLLRPNPTWVKLPGYPPRHVVSDSNVYRERTRLELTTTIIMNVFQLLNLPFPQ